MKIYFIRKYFLSILLSCGLFFAISSSLSAKISEDKTDNVNINHLAEGLIYKKIITEKKHHVHILEVDPKYFTMLPVHANGEARGKASVATMANEHQAVAAVNGGFFLDGVNMAGLPAGILKINQQWYGIAYRNRGAIGWSTLNTRNSANTQISPNIQNSAKTQISPNLHNQTNLNPVLDRLQTKVTLDLANVRIPIPQINRPPKINGTVLYTDAYGSHAESITKGRSIVIQRGKVIAISTTKHVPIPKEGFVYNIGPKAKQLRLHFKIGMKAEVKFNIMPQFNKEAQLSFLKFDHIVGGTPLLIVNGRIPHFKEEIVLKDFLQKPHARTAVGLLKNGLWIFVVVSSDKTGGMNMMELAKFMKKLGVTDAINLDGGRSSTLYLKKLGTVAKGYEASFVPHTREVSDAIVIVPKTLKN